MNLRIAELSVEITGFLDPVYRVLEPYAAPSVGAFVPDIRIVCSYADRLAALPLNPCYGVYRGIQEYGRAGDCYVSQDRSGDRSLATITFREDFHEASCSLVDVEAYGGADLVTRTNVALKNCFVRCLPAFGSMAYHASCIAYHGRAILFAGSSGAGKSTQTGLWRRLLPGQVEYINDDGPILRRGEDGRFWAYGSPWAGTSGIQNNIAAPVAGIVYVVQNAQNTIRALSGKEKALRALCSMPSQPAPSQRERQVRLLFQLLEETPVYELCCDCGGGSVAVVREALALP